MMGSRCLFLRLTSSSSTWGRRIITEENTGSLIFFVRSPFNARLEENKNKGNRGKMNTSLLIESRRYCHTTISPPFSDNPKSQKNYQQLKSAGPYSEITKLCKENKASEAFSLFQKHPTLFDGKDLLTHYKNKGDQESLNSAMRVYFILTKSEISPDQDFLGNLMFFCNQHSQFHSTLNIFKDMEKYHIEVKHYCFSKITFAMYKTKDENVAKKMLQILKDGNDIKANALVCNNILSVLANFDDAMWIFDYMLKNNIEFNEGCVIEYLNACILEASSNDRPAILEKGKQIHEQITKLKFDSNTKVLNALIHMYAKCGDPFKSVELHRQMIANNITPDQYTFAHILTAISIFGPEAIKLGEHIHQEITKLKFDSDVILINLLIRMYNKCGEPNKSLEVYDQMTKNKITPTEITFNHLLAAISNIGPNALEKGKQIHQQIIQLKFINNTKIITTLIEMYNKCGEPNTSLKIFDDLLHKAAKIDKFVFTNILSAISNIGPIALEKGKQIHQLITRQKIELDTQLTNAIMGMYNKCGEPNKSLEMYSQIPVQQTSRIDKFTLATTLSTLSNIGPIALEKGKLIHQQITQHKLDSDIVLLNALIQMYGKCGEPNTSVQIYDKMISNNITPDQITLVNTLSAISSLGPNALEKGKQIHQFITQHNLDTIRIIFNSLIQMYSTCGEPENAVKLYEQLFEKNIAPNEYTYKHLFQAIAKIGNSALEKGKELHQRMATEGFDKDTCS